MSVWPVEIQSVGLASSATRLWRFRNRLQLTTIVKGTFTFNPGGSMALVATQEIHLGDVHFGDDPRRSLRASSDIVPYRAKADIVLTGWIYAAPETTARGLAVRLAVVRAKPLIDKTIQVLGDRVAPANTGVGFAQMPLLYERAFGGPEWSDNPIGTGAAPGTPLPNLVDPSNPQRSVGFGPIAPSWPARSRLLKTLDPDLLDEQIPALPDDFDWAYYQAAPPDQRTEFLRGDERIVLENMYASHPSLHTMLPTAKAIGRLYGLKGDDKGLPITLNADSLHIDTENGRCSVTWRASLPLQDDVDLSRLHVVAGIEVPGHPIHLPGLEPFHDGAPSGPKPGAPAEPSSVHAFERTMSLDPDEIVEIVENVTPFVAAPPPALSAKPTEATIDLTSSFVQGPALPFLKRGPSPLAAPISLEKLSANAAAQVQITQSRQKQSLEGTLDLTNVAAVRGPALPFIQEPAREQSPTFIPATTVPEAPPALAPLPPSPPVFIAARAAEPTSHSPWVAPSQTPVRVVHEPAPSFEIAPPPEPARPPAPPEAPAPKPQAAAAPAVEPPPVVDPPPDDGPLDEEADELDEPTLYSTPASRAQARTLGILMVAENDELNRFLARHVAKESGLGRDDVVHVRDLLRALTHALAHPGDRMSDRIRDAWTLVFHEPRLLRKKRRLAKKGSTK